MSMIIDNWQLIVAMICAVACIVETVLVFVQEPNSKKIANLKEFLLWAVVESEKALGSGTGALKLRYCYNLCVSRFEWLPKIVDFYTFSKWVDDALVWMRTQLESNKSVKDYVEGETDGIQ